MPAPAKLKTQSRPSPLAAALNELLAGSIDLKLQAKQAHWNVQGENFQALHLLFDNVATQADGFADLIAERIVQLGVPAQGTLQDITRNTALSAYSSSTRDARKHVASMTAALTAQSNAVKSGIRLAEKQDDAVTADILTQVAGGLDKLRWMVESHL